MIRERRSANVVPGSPPTHKVQPRPCADASRANGAETMPDFSRGKAGRVFGLFILVGGCGLVASCAPAVSGVKTDPVVKAQRIPTGEFDDKIDDNAKELRERGREIFRYDTFGSEAFWGGKCGLHRAVGGQEHGGVGQGLTRAEALKVGLKVDVGKLPSILVEAIKGGKVDLDKTGTTIELLKADSVVGVKAFFNEKGDTMTGIGITCAFCHATVDDSLTAGIGRRLD